MKKLFLLCTMGLFFIMPLSCFAEECVEYHVEGTQCVELNQTYTYNAVRDNGSLGPNATSFKWFVNGVVVNGQNSSNLSLPIDGNAKNKMVQALGYDGCDAAKSDTFKIMVNPQQPTGIIRTENGCITAGGPDTITLQITGALTYQDYYWDLSQTHSWQIINYNTTNHSEVTIRTSGIAGVDSVKAYTAGNNLCQDTRKVKIGIETPATTIELYNTPNIVGYSFIQTLNLPSDKQIVSYQWYIDNIPTISNSYYALIATHGNIISLRLTYNDGCSEYVSIDISSGIQQMQRYERNTSKSSKLHIKPNPAQHTANIDFSKVTDKAVISIYNMAGSLISSYETNENSTTFDISNYPEGMYPIVVNQEGNISADILIIKH